MRELTSRASEELSRLASYLQQLVRQFHLGTPNQPLSESTHHMDDKSPNPALATDKSDPGYSTFVQ
jgi:hypothetical protein